MSKFQNARSESPVDPAPPPGARRSTAGAAWQSLLRAELGPLLALLVIVVVFGVADQLWAGGYFASVRNLRVILNQSSIVGVAALGMTIIIISGGIDLSAGTALTLSATVLAYALKHDYPVAIALLAGIITGSLCGLLNGALISWLRVVPFIVTLGTMTIFLGVGKIVADETTIFPSFEQIPFWLRELCTTKAPDVVWGVVPNISIGVMLAAVLAVGVAAVLRLTVFGRHVFALGSNESTARLCGIHVGWTKLAVYSLAGALIGVAGIYHFATLKIANPVEGIGLELQIIAAVVIGGGSLNGGRGSVVGTLTGAVIMAVIRSGCDQLRISNPYQEILLGAIIIAAVAVDQWRSRRRES